MLGHFLASKTIFCQKCGGDISESGIDCLHLFLDLTYQHTPTSELPTLGEFAL